MSAAGTGSRHGGIVVVSPHLDDAVLSVGATVAALVQRGARVSVLTVFGGDPTSELPAGPSNRRAGFRTVGEAARARRAEDGLACRRVGARAVWLPYADDESVPLPAADSAWGMMVDFVERADLVLVPGFPLAHPHHRWVTELLLARTPDAVPVGCYVEQPYASWSLVSRGGAQSSVRQRQAAVAEFTRLLASRAPRVRLPGSPARLRDYAAKYRAASAYRSQLAVLRRWPLLRIGLHDALGRGECLGLPVAG